MANWFNKPQEDGQGQETAPPESNELVVANGPSEESKTFSLLSQAQNAIAQAQSLDEIKDIRDKAEAARKYAQAAGMGLEIQNYAAEVKLRAERRAGGLLAHLHLWATNDSLFYAKRALEHWGFELKSCLLCLNAEGRPGNYWAEAHEYLLLGVRGNLTLQERDLKS